METSEEKIPEQYWFTRLGIAAVKFNEGKRHYVM